MINTFGEIKRSAKRAKYHHRTNNQDSDSESEDGGAAPAIPGLPDIASLMKKDKKSVYRDHNHIYFRCAVTMEKVHKLQNLIEEYNREQETLMNDMTSNIVVPKPIYLHITSSGGDLYAGFIAYDYINNSNIPIYTISEAYAISAGSLMFMAGKKRFITESSYLLIHQLSSTQYGKSNFMEMVDEAKNSIEFMERIYRIYLGNLRYSYSPVPMSNIMTKEKLENHMLHDIFWNAKTCIAFGLADGIYYNYQERDQKDLEYFTKPESRKIIEQPDIHFTENDFHPSEEVIEKLEQNMAKNNDMLEVISSYLKKKGDKHGANPVMEDDEDESGDEALAQPPRKIMTRSKGRKRKARN